MVTTRASEPSEGKFAPKVHVNDVQFGYLRGEVQGSGMLDVILPLPGATVLIVSGPPHQDIAALTDANGQYSLYDLLPGIYDVMANAEGYQQSTQKCRIAQGQTTILNFNLFPQEI